MICNLEIHRRLTVTVCMCKYKTETAPPIPAMATLQKINNHYKRTPATERAKKGQVTEMLSVSGT